MSTRKSSRPRYAVEWTDQDHRDLLSLLLEVPAAVMLSGYPSALYDDALSSWHTHQFQAPTRRGPATEKLWMNFDPATVLKHEYTYAGDNFRERERIKRKAGRWVSNLARLPEGERNFILQEMSRTFSREFHHHSSILTIPADTIGVGDTTRLQGLSISRTAKADDVSGVLHRHGQRSAPSSIVKKDVGRSRVSLLPRRALHLCGEELF